MTERTGEPVLTAESAKALTEFSLYRKAARTLISDRTFPPGTVYETPEGLRAEDEDTRAALDVQGGIYPIRVSVFKASYVPDDEPAAPSQPVPSGLDELAFSIDAIERRIGDKSWTTADGLSVIAPIEAVRDVLRAARRTTTTPPADEALRSVWIVARAAEPAPGVMGVYDNEDDAREDWAIRTGRGSRPDLERKYVVESWSVGGGIAPRESNR